MKLGAGGLWGIYLILGICYFFQITGWFMIVLVVVAIACYAMTLGPVTWVLLAEIFPNRVRAVAVATSTFALWVGSSTLTYTFPLLNVALGSYGTFWIYSAVCLGGFLFVSLMLPETKGKSLEELEKELIKHLIIMCKARRETGVTPTYEGGTHEKNPIFLEKRVYQGSSGVVYPYPVIERISDEKVDKEWHAIWIENEYIKVMILPELGGRVQMAYDKIKQRHFVYYNHVIKPALVGLTGPWISGGIEFNWPQHHRPSTYLPVDSTFEENEDGSVTVWVNEMEKMFHQKGMAGFTLRPGKAYLEIKGRLYNRTNMPQTFLWWANPAVAVNDYYQSVFPQDINAVFDHGKRAVSSFPIATGTYYKMDYSAGVDISNYKNIKVPTSYMGVNSKFDFEGGYENDTQAGMLHVANHHVSPGKKQWTWGNGDFGQAWDRNLTDTDGPYIELMAGVFTENQPDFTWLMPYEEKRFTQYFMPYRELGVVKCANKDLIMNINMVDEDGKMTTADATGKVNFKLFATSKQQVKAVLRNDNGTVYYEKVAAVDPENLLDEMVAVGDSCIGQLTFE